MGRKNWLFWTGGRGQIRGRIQSLISTCRLHGIDPTNIWSMSCNALVSIRQAQVAELTRGSGSSVSPTTPAIGYLKARAVTKRPAGLPVTFNMLSDPVTTAGSADMLASLVRVAMASGALSLPAMSKISASFLCHHVFRATDRRNPIPGRHRRLRKGAGGAGRKRSSLVHQIDMRWLAPRMKAAARHAALLEAMGQWSNVRRDAYRSAKRGGRAPSLAREHHSGLRALAAVMADIDDPSTKLFLDLPGDIRIRGRDALLRYYATKTIIHYQLDDDAAPTSEFAHVVAAGREMAEVLRRIRSSGESASDRACRSGLSTWQKRHTPRQPARRRVKEA